MQSFRASVAKLLTEPLCSPDYEIISRLQKIIAAHRDFTMLSRRYDEPLETSPSRCTRYKIIICTPSLKSPYRILKETLRDLVQFLYRIRTESFTCPVRDSDRILVQVGTRFLCRNLHKNPYTTFNCWDPLLFAWNPAYNVTLCKILCRIRRKIRKFNNLINLI